MKKSTLFLLGILITGMAFGLVLAGCDSTGDTEDPAAAATQLAEDINALRAGSATANGATVTLSGGLSLESQFTVPAGVTLDLTGDGELGLLDATLTVNGTVKAGSNKVRMRSAASWSTINGSGTIQLKGRGRLLEVGRSDNVANRKLTLDGVTLVGVADNENALVQVHEGGEFVMRSGKIMGNTRARGGSVSGSGVESRGTFTMSGGEISGNTVNTGDHAGGGGVWIGEGSVFTMSGGAITGNTAAGTNTNRTGQGGGVDVRGAFTMSGGKISGNTAEGDEHGGGGGVRINGDGASFTMKGGEISGNSATSNDWSEGGGVKLENNATFTMEGGTISGNIASGKRGSNSGGVRVHQGSVFTMSGGTISGNTADEVGGGINVRGTFTMKGGKITGNTARSGGGVRVDENGGVFTMEDGEISGNTVASDGGGIEVRGTFTMKGGKITGNTARDGGGVRLDGDGSTFTMEGGTVSGNTASNSGGGVRANYKGTFTMKDGAISGNTAKYGVGVAVNEAAFIMEGGTIYGKAGSLPAGSDANLANIAQGDDWDAALNVNSNGTAKWGMGGTYTKGGASQTGGSDIVSLNNGRGGTSDTLIAR
jgi:hypothetical protein